MTNAATISTRNITRGIARVTKADHAPMVITRLSGWINVGEAKAAAPAWIIPTRSSARR
jgi:hypothetical protein